jgi:hypothetical protein
MIFRASRHNVLKWNGVQIIVGVGPESLRAVLRASTRTGGHARSVPEFAMTKEDRVKLLEEHLNRSILTT